MSDVTRFIVAVIVGAIAFVFKEQHPKYAYWIGFGTGVIVSAMCHANI